MKLVGWAVVAVLVVVLISNSTRQAGLSDGAKGSYLGRMVNDAQVPPDIAKALANRVETQRN
ncbi:MAG: hypothetical protein HY057_05600 [Rhodospirillales bacterium]|nr:hypothetical protein [Rhodospirillales bacterium]